MQQATHNRRAELKRQTKETTIDVQVVLDGQGRYDIKSGIGFLDHMLELWTRHSLMDVTLKARGDTQVDCHHTTEDVGIVLGLAIKQALGDKRGIARYGHALVPMDEALVLVALDCSGRGLLSWSVNFSDEKLGTLATASIREWFHAFALNSGVTLHVRQLAGGNSHHSAEAAFKGCARALRQAIAIDERQKEAIPSTKGTL
ncbi:MAG: imidazoleglycerol-phosphate dehydratase HisB [Alphaproteobacteria bacterium GM202ARS2]|nr:imidazoleglycerol-phosphate dehydratase HisB [Alphaproteobacteria bacterium GM202ARS2]